MGLRLLKIMFTLGPSEACHSCELFQPVNQASLLRHQASMSQHLAFEHLVTSLVQPCCKSLRIEIISTEPQVSVNFPNFLFIINFLLTGNFSLINTIALKKSPIVVPHFSKEMKRSLCAKSHTFSQLVQKTKSLLSS